jgi:hypothetical protein
MSHSVAAKSALPFVALLLSGALGACSGGGAAGNDAAAGSAGMKTAGTTGTAGVTGSAGATATAGSTGNADALVGTFAFTLDTRNGGHQAAVSGRVSNGPAAVASGLKVSMKDGACTLFTPSFPFCSPVCPGTDVCVADDVCRTPPTAMDLGDVNLSGVKAQAGGTTILLVNVKNGYQVPGDTPLAYPPFDEGADVGVSAAGGAYGPFEIHGKGIAPLVVTDTDLTVDRNKPLVLGWTPKGAGSDATIHVKLEISHHGGFKGQVECDTADTGALTISAPIVTALVNLGVGGFPTVTVARTSTTSTKIAPGRVELQLSHAIERDVIVPDLVSCTDKVNSTDCPTGKICQDNQTCTK